MGGWGSGKKYWVRTKKTVEDSVIFSIKTFRSQIFPNSAGQSVWTRSNGQKSTLGFCFTLTETERTLTINYRFGEGEEIRIPIRLQITPIKHGGFRWWFTCPLGANGVACARRVGNLYLPLGAKYFGCRHCHDLTYRSSQKAHYGERREKFLENFVKNYGSRGRRI